MDLILINNIYYIVSFFFRCIIIFYILKAARHTKLNSLYLLATHVFLIGSFSLILLFWGRTGFLEAAMYPDLIVLAIFLKLNFYKDKKSPFALILSTIIILETISIILEIVFPEFFFHFRTTFNVLTMLIGLWYFYVSFDSYRNIKDADYVEDWIKARYKLVMAYGIILMLTALMWQIVLWFIILTGESHLFANLPLMIVYTASPIIEFLAWVMPNRFRVWLNRNYTFIDESDKLSDEEIMKSFGGT